MRKIFDQKGEAYSLNKTCRIYEFDNKVRKVCKQENQQHIILYSTNIIYKFNVNNKINSEN